MTSPSNPVAPKWNSIRIMRFFVSAIALLTIGYLAGSRSQPAAPHSNLAASENQTNRSRVDEITRVAPTKQERLVAVLDEGNAQIRNGRLLQMVGGADESSLSMLRREALQLKPSAQQAWLLAEIYRR